MVMLIIGIIVGYIFTDYLLPHIRNIYYGFKEGAKWSIIFTRSFGWQGKHDIYFEFAQTMGKLNAMIEAASSTGHCEEFFQDIINRTNEFLSTYHVDNER